MQDNLTKAWEVYLPRVRKHKTAGISSAQDPPHVADDLIMYQSQRYTVAFAPFNTPQAVAQRLRTAAVLFVGLTPGRHQACQAIQSFIAPEHDGRDKVAFAGSMRTNMVKMLDAVGLAACLDIETTADLFTRAASTLFCSTSLLRFPVFVGEAQTNFSGTAASINKEPFLRRMVDELFAPMLDGLDHPLLVVPMGKTVEQFCVQLVAGCKHAQVLQGFPHPSGGNGHRTRIFTTNVESLRNQIETFKQYRADWLLASGPLGDN